MNVPVTIPASFTASTYSYSAVINSTNVIGETLTNNNTATTIFNVLGTLNSTNIPLQVVDDMPIVGKNVSVTITNSPGVGQTAANRDASDQREGDRQNHCGEHDDSCGDGALDAVVGGGD